MAFALGNDPVYMLGAWAGNVLDDYGVEWYVTEEAGWSSGVNVRATLEERENQHGATDGPSFFESRTVTLTGEAYAAQGRAAMIEAKDRLVTAFMVEGLAYFRVRDATGKNRWCLVRPTGSLQVSDIGSKRFSWQFSVRAPDPRKYADPSVSRVSMRQSTTKAGLRYPLRFPLRFSSQTQVQEGMTQFTNSGTADTWPEFVITGPCPGFIITEHNTSSTLTYNGSLAAGDVLTMNSLSGQVLLNGTTDTRALLDFTRWWSVPAGGVAKVSFESSAEQTGATLDVSVKPAWW